MLWIEHWYIRKSWSDKDKSTVCADPSNSGRNLKNQAFVSLLYFLSVQWNRFLCVKRRHSWSDLPGMRGDAQPLEKFCTPWGRSILSAKFCTPMKKSKIGQFNMTLKQLSPKSAPFSYWIVIFQNFQPAAGYCRMHPFKLCTPWDFALDPALRHLIPSNVCW